MQQRVLQHAGVAGAQHEAIAVGPLGRLGSAWRKRSKIVYASGASAIAVPGWPALAFCTASIARPRIVSIDSLLISGCSTEPILAMYSRWIMSEQFCEVSDGITLCYETFGDPGDPAALLIMGLGAQMVAWQEDFCEELAERGLYVVRFDNRDIGRSTHLQGPPPSSAQLLRYSVLRPLQARGHGRRTRSA